MLQDIGLILEEELCMLDRLGCFYEGLKMGYAIRQNNKIIVSSSLSFNLIAYLNCQR